MYVEREFMFVDVCACVSCSGIGFQARAVSACAMVVCVWHLIAFLDGPHKYNVPLRREGPYLCSRRL